MIHKIGRYYYYLSPDNFEFECVDELKRSELKPEH